MKLAIAVGLLSFAALSALCGAAVAQGVVSELPEILVAEASKLPEGPHPVRGDDNCSGDLIDPATAAGRYVAERGWGVVSEVAIGDTQLVSFAGEFISGTSGSCAVQQGNIGVFDGADLKAILYTANKTDELIGVLVALDAGRVRLWSAGYLASPVADIAAGSAGMIVGAVAAEDTFCAGTVAVPNVYDMPITEAREKLKTSGWRPVPQPKEEWGQQVALHEIGITEAVTCSGTGFGYCTFSYDRPEATLELLTAGELFETHIPSVVSYGVTCAP